MSTDTPGQRLELARKAAGYATAIQAANAMGISYPTYAGHENGQRGIGRMAERYARFFKVSLDWLLMGRGVGPSGVTLTNTAPPPPVQLPFERSPDAATPNATIGEKVTGYGKKIPVYGQAVGGVDGEFLMNGNILFEVMAPPILSHITGAYGVQITGESMYPRYEDGEICFVDPTRRVRRGDYVIAQIQNDEHGPLLAYAKKFIRHNAEELVLEQFNPPKELRFDADTVVSVHFIALAGSA